MSKLLIIFISSLLFSCSLMPRTDLSSDSNNIVGSKTSSEKPQINLFPIDAKTAEENSKRKYKYLIGSRDQLDISVWGHPELNSQSGVPLVAAGGNLTAVGYSPKSQVFSGMDLGSASGNGNSYVVDSNGKIYMPLIGAVDVAGKSLDVVRNELQQKLKYYLINPQVSLRISGYRSKMVYVVGEITQPNMIYLNDVPLDLAAALSISGWVNLASANVKEIYVLRKNNNKGSIIAYQLDATTPTSLVFASGFALKDSDIVFVSTAGVAQFGRVTAQLINAAELLWYVKTTVSPNGGINILPNAQ